MSVFQRKYINFTNYIYKFGCVYILSCKKKIDYQISITQNGENSSTIKVLFKTQY